MRKRLRKKLGVGEFGLSPVWRKVCAAAGLRCTGRVIAARSHVLGGNRGVAGADRDNRRRPVLRGLAAAATCAVLLGGVPVMAAESEEA